MNIKNVRGVLIACCAAVVHTASAVPPQVDVDGTIHVPAFELPESAYLSEEARAALKQARGRSEENVAAFARCPAQSATPTLEEMAVIRRCQAAALYSTSGYKELRTLYPVSLTREKMGGVPVEIFVPEAGIAPQNRDKVLINLHGGGFFAGSGTNSHAESVPIAAAARIKVISVDYRLAPEYLFPAASEDSAAVYREVIKHYKPKNIGIYGCSAGANLTAQSMAWFQKEKLPLPAAIGLFCFGAHQSIDKEKPKWMRSDSANLNSVFIGVVHADRKDLAQYYKGSDMRDPLISPANDDKIMANFPPSLLITGTRDYAMSSVIATHAQLVRLGVQADLHVWEGMTHAFLYNPAFPESREAYSVIVKFFDRHLGAKQR